MYPLHRESTEGAEQDFGGFPNAMAYGSTYDGGGFPDTIAYVSEYGLPANPISPWFEAVGELDARANKASPLP
jgi:hypothetical protein